MTADKVTMVGGAQPRDQLFEIHGPPAGLGQRTHIPIKGMRTATTFAMLAK